MLRLLFDEAINQSASARYTINPTLEVPYS